MRSGPQPQAPSLQAAELRLAAVAAGQPAAAVAAGSGAAAAATAAAGASLLALCGLSRGAAAAAATAAARRVLNTARHALFRGYSLAAPATAPPLGAAWAPTATRAAAAAAAAATAATRASMHSTGAATAAAAAAAASSARAADRLPGARQVRTALGLAARGVRPAAAGAVVAGAVAVGTGAVAAGSGAAAAARWMSTSWEDSKGYLHFQGRGRAWPLSSPRARYGLAVTAVGGVGYYLWCLEEVPYTGRRRSIMLVSQSSERRMGKEGFEQLKALARGRLLPPQHPAAQRVQRLGAAIAAVAADGGGGGQYAHMSNLHWEFAVIEDPTPNAFVLPGGKVVVFTGLLALLGDRADDQLASVLAHEVGHVLARHAAENMSKLNVWALTNMVLHLAFGFSLPDVAVVLGVFLPHSRLAEHEADVIGLRLMARACFDPAAMPLMLAALNSSEKTMVKAGRATRTPAFLSTHPLTEDRVARVEKELPAAYRLYEAAGCAAQRSAFARGVAAGGWGAADDGWESARF